MVTNVKKISQKMKKKNTQLEYRKKYYKIRKKNLL